MSLTLASMRERPSEHGQQACGDLRYRRGWVFAHLPHLGTGLGPRLRLPFSNPSALWILMSGPPSNHSFPYTLSFPASATSYHTSLLLSCAFGYSGGRSQKETSLGVLTTLMPVLVRWQSATICERVSSAFDDIKRRLTYLNTPSGYNFLHS
jgi:hypothetical protein